MGLGRLAASTIPDPLNGAVEVPPPAGGIERTERDALFLLTPAGDVRWMFVRPALDGLHAWHGLTLDPAGDILVAYDESPAPFGPCQRWTTVSGDRLCTGLVGLRRADGSVRRLVSFPGPGRTDWEGVSSITSFVPRADRVSPFS